MFKASFLGWVLSQVIISLVLDLVGFPLRLCDIQGHSLYGHVHASNTRPLACLRLCLRKNQLIFERLLCSLGDVDQVLE